MPTTNVLLGSGLSFSTVRNYRCHRTANAHPFLISLLIPSSFSFGESLLTCCSGKDANPTELDGLLTRAENTMWVDWHQEFIKMHDYELWHHSDPRASALNRATWAEANRDYFGSSSNTLRYPAQIPELSLSSTSWFLLPDTKMVLAAQRAKRMKTIPSPIPAFPKFEDLASILKSLVRLVILITDNFNLPLDCVHWRFERHAEIVQASW